MGNRTEQENRRRFLLTTAGLLAAGCQYNSGRGPLVRGGVTGPVDRQIEPPVGPAETTRSVDQARFVYGPLVTRSYWTKSNPRQKGLEYLSGQLVSKVKAPSDNLPNRITVHHDAMLWEGRHDYAGAVDRLQRIRTIHLKRGWNDIGYHFAIDGRGRVWQCRPLRYKGAHVGGQNIRNLGIVVMGNFEEQKPTLNQLVALQDALQKFSNAYKIPCSQIKGHKDRAPNLCPGKNLYPKLQDILTKIC